MHFHSLFFFWTVLFTLYHSIPWLIRPPMPLRHRPSGVPLSLHSFGTAKPPLHGGVGPAPEKLRCIFDTGYFFNFVKKACNILSFISGFT